MEYGYTIYTVPEDINMMAGDTVRKSFNVFDRNGNAVDLGLSGTTITAKFCRYNEPNKPIVMTPPEGGAICKKDDTVDNKFWLTLYPQNTAPTTPYTNSVNPQKDTYLEYQIFIKDFYSVDRSRVCRVSGRIKIKPQPKQAT